jgi:hypothetical protein
VGFNAWFDALSPVLKIAVILGIVVASFALATSFVASVVRIWKMLAQFHSKRKK